ncbi:MAG: nitroreductase family protein [Candidatus Bipolaricaulaceae bacterium]
MCESVLQFITRRRSIREFTGDPVDRSQLEVALQAAMAAPSARNSRPWEFVVVTDRERIRSLCTAHPHAGFGVDAGAVVLPVGRREGYDWFDQDMAAATQNFLLAVANLGLGATWCGMTPKLQDAIRPLVGLPEAMTAFALIPVGVPAQRRPARTQYEPERVHWEQYRCA